MPGLTCHLREASLPRVSILGPRPEGEGWGDGSETRGSRYQKSMSALPIILKQNSVSVGLFTLLRERELGLTSKPNGQ